MPALSSLHPKELVTELLPFQKRTLAKLLQREWSNLVPQMARNRRDPDGFWSALDLGAGGKVAYRRLTGDIVQTEPAVDKSNIKGKGRADNDDNMDLAGLAKAEREVLPILVDLSGVRGTMLCEEMGECYWVNADA
jgi:E3 ubiquitin-protein ligase SHPRH